MNYEQGKCVLHIMAVVGCVDTNAEEHYFGRFRELRFESVSSVCFFSRDSSLSESSEMRVRFSSRLKKPHSRLLHSANGIYPHR